MPEEKKLSGTKQNITSFSPLADLAPMTKNQVMDLAMDLGKILLKSGAETSRVEDTMMRFCRSYGYYDLNVFCTPTVIILGDESPRGKSRVFRVRWRATDLGLMWLRGWAAPVLPCCWVLPASIILLRRS